MSEFPGLIHFHLLPQITRTEVKMRALVDLWMPHYRKTH